MALKKKPLTEKDGKLHEHPGTFVGVSYLPRAGTKRKHKDSAQAYQMQSPRDASGQKITRCYLNQHMAALVYARTRRFFERNPGALRTDVPEQLLEVVSNQPNLAKSSVWLAGGSAGGGGAGGGGAGGGGGGGSSSTGTSSKDEKKRKRAAVAAPTASVKDEVGEHEDDLIRLD